MSLHKLNRYKGCLVGLAVGDALGTTLEFSPPGSFEPISDMVGEGPFGLKPGQWNDDTSMALCLAESLVEKRVFDPVDQLERYTGWYREGYMSSTGRCFDIGGTVRQALLKFDKTRQDYCGSSDPHSAGNGSIMRLAPVPIFYSGEPKDAIEKSGESSRTTHQAATCIDACRYMGGLIVGALIGVPKDELLAERYSPISGCCDEHPLVEEIDQIAAGSFKLLEPPAIKGTGYVVKTLEASLWAFFKTNSFKEGCLMAVNLGHDADTTGAVYGQIAGVFYGEEDIPIEWRQRLAKLDIIESLAQSVFRLSHDGGM